MKKLLCSIIAIAAFVSPAGAEPIPSGGYKQTFSTYGGQCATCSIYVKYKTAHIIEISANNNWIGYAVYDQDTDKYVGFWEWRRGANMGPSLQDVVHKFEATFDDGTLTMSVNRPGMMFRIIYEKQK